MINATPQLNASGVISDTNQHRSTVNKNDNKQSIKIITSMSFPPFYNLNKHQLTN